MSAVCYGVIKSRIVPISVSLKRRKKSDIKYRAVEESGRGHIILLAEKSNRNYKNFFA